MWKNNAAEEPYAKTAYAMKLTLQGVDYYAGVGYNNVCLEDYAAMPSCRNSPNSPRTQPGGVGVCIPKTGGMSMKCSDVKKYYKQGRCCAEPEKDLDFGAYRRLSQGAKYDGTQIRSVKQGQSKASAKEGSA